MFINANYFESGTSLNNDIKLVYVLFIQGQRINDASQVIIARESD